MCAELLLLINKNCGEESLATYNLAKLTQYIQDHIYTLTLSSSTGKTQFIYLPTPALHSTLQCVGPATAPLVSGAICTTIRTTYGNGEYNRRTVEISRV